MEDVDDESDQDDGHEDVDEDADIRGISCRGQQEPFQLFSRCNFLGQQKAGRVRGGYPACIRIQYIIFHNTYFTQLSHQ